MGLPVMYGMVGMFRIGVLDKEGVAAITIYLALLGSPGALILMFVLPFFYRMYTNQEPRLVVCGGVCLCSL